jgi:hypothetical protein
MDVQSNSAGELMDELVMVTSMELSERELAELRDLTEQNNSMEAI